MYGYTKEMEFQSIFWIGSICSVVLYLVIFFWDYHFAKFASGPRSWPLVGNIWTVYKLHTDTERVLERLGKYGELCQLWIGRWPVIVVNGTEAAHDILHKRGALTFSRPAHNDLRIQAGRGRLVLTPAGPGLVKLRKIYHRLLNSERTQKSYSIMERESCEFLAELLQDSANSTFYESCERYALSIIFTSTYGVRLRSGHNEVVSGLFRIWNVLLKYFQPGTVILPDTFPILLKLPRWFQPWRILSDRLITSELEIHQRFIDRIKDLSAVGKAPECYATSLLKDQEVEGIDDGLIQGTIAMIIGAGSDTTGSVLQTFFKVIALHPEVLTTAQKELDSVVGRERLPTWEDEKNLPYIRGLIKEIHRWAPIGCIGIPHAATETLSYKDCLIPKGTIIFPNLVTLNKDPNRYERPEVFDTLRFKDDPLDAYACAVSADWKKRDHFHYGFGRRVCLGISVGEASLFIAISRILWAFNIAPVHGCKLDTFEKMYGLATKPKLFKVDVSTRDAAVEKTVCQELELMQEKFSTLQEI